MLKHRPPLFGDQRGQVFAGYIIAIMLVTLVMVSVSNLVRRDRRATDARVYQDQALMVAREGFEEGLSYFRRQPSGVYLEGGAEKPTSQALVATPWPLWPDAAFLPAAADTDHWNALSFSANVTMNGPGPMYAQGAGARALIRTFPLATVATTGTAEVRLSPLWGRFVLRRQNYRNWSPGTNTYTVFTDVESAHDLTHMRGLAVPGSGNRWSIVSRSYIFANQLNVTYSAAYENTAMFEGNCLLSAPKRTYNNKPLLLATARVYGELYRINFMDQAAAAWTKNGSDLTVTTNGIVTGGTTGVGLAMAITSSPTVSGGFLGGTQATYYANGMAPTTANVFPGLSSADLYKLADKKGAAKDILPTSDQSNLSDIASNTTFYYITSSGTVTFNPGTATVLTGVGLAYIEGNVIFKPGNLSAWSGIVFVSGTCEVHGPVEISGSLIVTGTLKVGQTGSVADINKANVEYNADAVQSVMTYLQRFHVDKNSILTTFN